MANWDPGLATNSQAIMDEAPAKEQGGLGGKGKKGSEGSDRGDKDWMLESTPVY